MVKSIVLQFIILMSFMQTAAYSQNLKAESITGSNYDLDIELTPVPYKLMKNNSRSILHFYNSIDESKPGAPVLPSKDLFIAVPQGSIPKINVSLLNKKEIIAEPELNPIVRRENDSSIVYSSAVTPKIPATNELFKVNGFLWIGNNYCLHLTIYQYQYDFQKRIIVENNTIRLSLNFDKPIMVGINEKKTVSPLILNKRFASVYQSNPIYHVQNTDDWIDYNSLYVKIGVAKDGVYRCDYNDLISLGVSFAGVDPRTFKMYNKGELVPIYVYGEGDGSFDPGDFVEFAGIRNMGGNYREVSEPNEPYNEYLGRYTDTTIYWLTWGGETGLRVELGNGNPSINAIDTLKYYSETVHKEINNWFDFSMADQVEREMPFWASNKTWNEGNLGVGVLNVNFNLSDIYPNAPAQMFVKLQDYASDISTNAHLLALSLNNYSTVYDSGYINKYEQKVLQGDFNSSLLVEGTNTLKVHSYQTSAALNICIRDWYEMEYPRYINTLTDSLLFSFDYISTPGIYCFYINAVQNNNITVWKFGGSYKKYNVTPSGGVVFIKDTIDAANKYFIIDSTRVLKPKLYYQKQFVNLRSNQNKADYISITNKQLLDEAAVYNNFIANNYNVETKLIDVDDIYDEFAYGYFDPESIRSFLEITHTNWQTPFPGYVFLIGDANYDYYYNKYVYQNTPPVQNIVPSFGAPVSDNWFVVWDTTGAYILQMDIGRLPIHTPQELNSYLERHQMYVSQPYNAWNKSYLFFSGGSDDQNELDILRETNQGIIDNYVTPQPIGGNWFHFYKTLNPVTNFGPFSIEYVQNAINQGGIFISYLGHSGTQTWDNSIADPSQLQNMYNRFPMITDFGCSTGKFAEPDVVSFSELFISAQKGQAISYIGNSSLGFTSTSTTFPQLFYKKILQDTVVNISDAHKLAKLELLQDYGSSGTYKLFALTNELIGDPVISLPIPQKPNLEIDGSGVKILSSNLSDLNDSAKVLFKYFNWGKVVNDTFLIMVQANYLGSTISIDSIYKVLPRYEDSLEISYPIFDRPGEHSITLTLDAANKIGEINENDNTFTLDFYVASSKIRTLLPYETENGLNNNLVIINPSIRSASDSIEIEIALNKDYTNSSFFYKALDSVRTIYTLPGQYLNKRIWLKGKIYNDNFVGFDKTTYNGTLNNYYLADSESFSNSQLSNLIYTNNIITLDTNKTQFRAISAGFNDGTTAIIEKNGENFVPGANLRGHHVCVFEDSTYNFIKYKLFDLLGGDSTTVRSYINFLDSLTNKQIVAIAISDEGYSHLTSELKSKLKEFGSRYIDSVVFRGSWAFIGRRGAAPGSMPEAYSKPFEGRVEIDTLIQKLFTSGTLTTSKIGPSAKWETVNISQNVPASTQINLRPIGIKSDATQDTLGFLNVQNGIADISGISALTYPDIKLLVGMQTNDVSQIPSISSIGVNYKSLPELGTNYQAAKVDKDSLNVGDDISLHFDVYNAGGSPADSFNVTVEIVKSDNSRETVLDNFVARLDTQGKKSFSLIHNTLGLSGTNQFYIKIDPDNKISELYKDNNIFTVPFYVRADSSRPIVNLTFDGNQIFDGDFVSNKPVIKIELNDPSYLPITDTTALSIKFNNKPLYYAGNQALTYQFNTANPKMVAEYRPHLTDGEYSINITAKNASGNFNDSAGVTRIFTVLSDTRLLYVYNYPNPFSGETYFTFKLTQVPDELNIHIYTVAGRLVKVIRRNTSELNTDFNRIYWDGKDEDGDHLANGVYFYKMNIKKDGKTESVTQKLAIVR